LHFNLDFALSYTSLRKDAIEAVRVQISLHQAIPLGLKASDHGDGWAMTIFEIKIAPTASGACLHIGWL
jgi:hypothetical protein